MIIDNKTLMYEQMILGKFGNTHPIFLTYDDYVKSGLDLTKNVCIRSMVPGGKFEYNFPFSELQERLSKRKDKIVISQVADGDNDRAIQGAVYRDPLEGLYLHYSYLQLDWRKALEQEGHHAYRTKAKIILEHYLDYPSLETIYRLLDEYPDHVIEFTTYNHSVGNLGHNTIIWEVRLY